MGSKASELDEKFGDEVAASPELEAGRLDNVETLPSGRLWLLGSAMVMNWTIGVSASSANGLMVGHAGVRNRLSPPSHSE
jgi:hypothetical protein